MIIRAAVTWASRLGGDRFAVASLAPLLAPLLCRLATGSLHRPAASLIHPHKVCRRLRLVCHMCAGYVDGPPTKSAAQGGLAWARRRGWTQPASELHRSADWPTTTQIIIEPIGEAMACTVEAASAGERLPSPSRLTEQQKWTLRARHSRPEYGGPWRSRATRSIR